MYGAVAKDHMDIVQFLWGERRSSVDGQRDLEACFKTGMKTAIPIALRSDNVAMVSFLHGIVPEAFSPYTLSQVAASGNLEMVQFLHSAGRPREDVDHALLVSARTQPTIAQFLIANDVFSDAVIKAAAANDLLIAESVASDDAQDAAEPLDPESLDEKIAFNHSHVAKRKTHGAMNYRSTHDAETLAVHIQLQQMLDRLSVQDVENADSTNCFLVPTAITDGTTNSSSFTTTAPSQPPKPMKKPAHGPRPRPRPRVTQTIGQQVK